MTPDEYAKLAEGRPLMGPVWRVQETGIAATLKASQPVEIGCIGWLDALEAAIRAQEEEMWLYPHDSIPRRLALIKRDALLEAWRVERQSASID